MSRRASDPVERAFQVWAALTAEQRTRFDDRRAGYLLAKYGIGTVSEKPKRSRKIKEAAGE